MAGRATRPSPRSLKASSTALMASPMDKSSATSSWERRSVTARPRRKANGRCSWRDLGGEVGNGKVIEQDLGIRLRPEAETADRVALQRLFEALLAVELDGKLPAFELDREGVPSLARRGYVANRIDDGPLPFHNPKEKDVVFQR